MNRVSGSLHISPGKTIKIGGVIAHDVKGLKGKMHNMNHEIKHLSFGDEFPGQINPLDETEVCMIWLIRELTLISIKTTSQIQPGITI